jgi:hypothetical protein
MTLTVCPRHLLVVVLHVWLQEKAPELITRESFKQLSAVVQLEGLVSLSQDSNPGLMTRFCADASVKQKVNSTKEMIFFISLLISY